MIRSWNELLTKSGVGVWMSFSTGQQDSREFHAWVVGCVQVMSMIPGFSAELMPQGREKESQTKIKKFMTMMDSMTDEGMKRSRFLHLQALAWVAPITEIGTDGKESAVPLQPKLCVHHICIWVKCLLFSFAINMLWAVISIWRKWETLLSIGDHEEDLRLSCAQNSIVQIQSSWASRAG